MTKGELIELLQDFDDDMDIGFAFPSGDYWRTIIVRIISEGSVEAVKHSDYHDEDIIANNSEDIIEEHRAMIVLR